MIQGDLHGTEWLSLATRYINRVTLQVNRVLYTNVIPCDVLYLVMAGCQKQADRVWFVV